MKYLISFLSLISFISCGKTALNAELGTPFKMTSSQNVKVTSTDIKLNGFKVVEDSRCPKDANCIWEGQVTAEFNMDGSVLIFNSSKSMDTLGYTFQIKSVEPEKIDGDVISNDHYILEVLILR